MVKLLTTPEEIAQLLNIDDDLEQVFPCTKGEVIQWLVGQTKLGNKNRCAVLAYFDNNNAIKGYLICVNGVVPPLFKGISIIYCNTPLSQGIISEWDDISEEFLQEVLKLAKKVNANNIYMSIDSSDDLLTPFIKRGWKKDNQRVHYKVSSDVTEDKQV